MTVKQGDRVRASSSGPTMVVLAASSTWAICEWFIDGGERRADLFEVKQLERIAVQQAQQPQPPEAPEDPGT